MKLARQSARSARAQLVQRKSSPSLQKAQPPMQARPLRVYVIRGNSSVPLGWDVPFSEGMDIIRTIVRMPHLPVGTRIHATQWIPGEAYNVVCHQQLTETGWRAKPPTPRLCAVDGLGQPFSSQATSQMAQAVSFGETFYTSYDKGHRHSVEIPQLGEYRPRLSMDDVPRSAMRGFGQEIPTMPQLPGYVTEKMCQARVDDAESKQKTKAYWYAAGGLTAGAMAGALLMR